jgi:hypothetical protein
MTCLYMKGDVFWILSVNKREQNFTITAACYL